MADLNSVTISGNLTKDPELRHLPSGSSVVNLRVACNGRRKVGDQWEDVPNYFDVSAFGGRAEFVNNRLSKGDPVFLLGRLQWREWEKDGQKRQGVSIVAEEIKSPAFFGGNGGSRSTAPADTSTAPAPSADPDDDIPF